MIFRSALTLKLFTSRKYGSIIAAPSFGLPESIGGKRNWDYRYTWIRDSAFTMNSFIKMGYYNEAEAFVNWLAQRAKKRKKPQPIQPLYCINGDNTPDEMILEHFEGYKGSKPVRVGNNAHKQIQLDIFGKIMDAIYLYNLHVGMLSYNVWEELIEIINWTSENWQRKGESIWEVRGGKHEFLFSRIMCWVAIDRGIRIASNNGFPCPLEHWRTVRDLIHKNIYEEFWDEEIESFVQYKGSKTVDASTLLMPLVRFISPDEPRWISTLKRIEEELTDDFFVHRYKTGKAAPDGMDGNEGTFSVCTFWLIQCLAQVGEVKKARHYLEKIFTYSNHLGLYAEELGKNGEQLGNFPQAFTHLGLINAVLDLDKKLSEKNY